MSSFNYVSNDIDEIIKENLLSLNSSTLIKLVCNIDQILANCFEKSNVYFIKKEDCRFCAQNKKKKSDPNALCKKHYALDFYNNYHTHLSDITIKDKHFILFGRYVKYETPLCTYLFYITPLFVDNSRFRVYPFPKDVFEDADKEMVYTWKLLENPQLYTFSIKDDPYILDCTNPLDISFRKV